MFDELIGFEPELSAIGDFVPLKKTKAKQVLAAQKKTADWLEELGVPSDEALDAQVQTATARKAFETLNFNANNDAQVAALATIKTPAAVQHLVGMLTAYDWEFVEQAKSLRGYTVSKILEETSHPDARIRLKALQMLGNVTEIALFTERVEVTKIDASEEEVEKRLRERLTKFLTAQDGASVREKASDAPAILDTEISQIAEVRKDA